MGCKQTFVTASLMAAIPHLYAQSLATMMPNGQCPAPSEATAYVYPAVYSQFFEDAATIFNFMGGTNSLVINGPTTVIVTSVITSTPTVGPNDLGGSSTSKRRKTSSSQTGSTTTTATQPAGTAECPDDSGEVVNGYYINCSSGSNGQTIDGAQQNTASLEACIELCNNTPDCVAASHQNNVENGPCYLYKTFSGFNPDYPQYDIAVSTSAYDPTSDGPSGSSSITSGSSVTSGPTSTMSSSTTTTTTTTSTVSSGSGSGSGICPAAAAKSPYSDIATTQQYYIFCQTGMDGDQQSLPLSGNIATDFPTCITRCSTTTGCIGVSYPEGVANGACTLYKTFEKPGFNFAVTSYDIAILQSTYNDGPADPPSNSDAATANGQCSVCTNPDDSKDGAEYQGFVTKCGEGAQGTQMTSLKANGTPVYSLCECIGICETYAADGCVSASVSSSVSATNAQSCYLNSDFQGYDTSSAASGYSNGVLASAYNTYVAKNSKRNLILEARQYRQYKF